MKPMGRAVLYVVGLVLMVATAVVSVSAAVASIQAPEISGSTLSTGVAALAGGLLIIRARWGR